MNPESSPSTVPWPWPSLLKGSRGKIEANSQNHEDRVRMYSTCALSLLCISVHLDADSRSLWFLFHMIIYQLQMTDFGLSLAKNDVLTRAGLTLPVRGDLPFVVRMISYHDDASTRTVTKSWEFSNQSTHRRILLFKCHIFRCFAR